MTILLVSVTIWEATAPVKLPPCNVPSLDNSDGFGSKVNKGGISRLAPRKQSAAGSKQQIPIVEWSESTYLGFNFLVRAHK